MLRLRIPMQESFSRTELLLRTFLGWFYIYLPHSFILFFLAIWGSILTFISFFSILFTGRYPESMFEYQTNLMRWNFRVQARMYHLADGYPPFSLESNSDSPQLEFDYPQSLSRGLAIIKLLFGWLYCGVPHSIALSVRMFITTILTFIAFWAVLFTGKYPESFFRFNLGTIRWTMKVNAYLTFMTDHYPEFSGLEWENERTN